jgi:hypothetical protein
VVRQQYHEVEETQEEAWRKDTKANHNSTNESISNMKECF